jgi:hypothetical protein
MLLKEIYSEGKQVMGSSGIRCKKLLDDLK